MMEKIWRMAGQHPGYEMFKTGIHAQRGVACADCHMPYVQEGAVKYSDHHITSPLDYIAPDFSTKESVQALAGVDMPKLVAEKEAFKATLLQEWNKQAVEKGLLNMETRKGMSNNTSYSK